MTQSIFVKAAYSALDCMEFETSFDLVFEIFRLIEEEPDQEQEQVAAANDFFTEEDLQDVKQEEKSNFNGLHFG